ncbi:hypothetical protein, partial [Staphylococcus aureus]|uniref:hypothetical protein n=1 Tax=Staphylococcus aureus TaxID=1280 RepID=UPI001C92D6EC
NKQHNTQLLTSKNNLQGSLNQLPSTPPITQQTIHNYNPNNPQPQTQITPPQPLIHNPHPTPQQISHQKHPLHNPLTPLNQAKHDLTPHTHAL